MEVTVVISALCTAIVGMAGFFAFVFKDERARSERLLARLDEQHKLVTDAVAILGKSVETVQGKFQLYDAIAKLEASREALVAREQLIKQLYEAIDKLKDVADVLEAQQGKRPTQRGGRE